MLDNANPESKIIDAVYRGACEPAELDRSIDLIAKYFDAVGATLAEIDHGTPEAQFLVGAGNIDQAFYADYGPYGHLDPAPRAFAPWRPVRSTQRIAFSAQNFSAGMSSCMNFCGHMRSIARSAARCFEPMAEFAMVGVHYGTKQKLVEDDDIARLGRLAPHLTRALQVRRLFLQSKARGQVLEAIVNRNPTALIALPASGPALFVNDAARRLAAENDGITLDPQGRLIAGDRTAARRLTQLHADVALGGAGGIERLRRPSGRPAYVVLVSPLPLKDDAVLRAGGGVLVAIHDPGRSIVSTVHHLAEILHLPLGPAKVLGALLDGIELKDYAEREAISMNTVKFHLKTAFDRTDTRSQVDLVRRALLALNDLAPYLRDI